jgi:hypothetical protein
MIKLKKINKITRKIKRIKVENIVKKNPDIDSIKKLNSQ